MNKKPYLKTVRNLFLSFVILSAASGCRDLLEDRAPGWLGSSIYTNLKNDGHFNYTARLIEDLNYKNVLAKTGSKTLFVASDEAYEDFFRKNPWGVHSYEQLSPAQKKLLLFGSMINNSYQLNTLSSSEGPTEGNCMRRLTALSVYDSVPVIDTSEMPAGSFWEKFRALHRNNIVCLKDFSVQPMVHFIESQLSRNKITNEDYDFLLNHTTTRKSGDASINGIPVVTENVKCSNGFVHEMEKVMTPLSNMAEIIRTNKNTKTFSNLLERFAAPYYNEAATNEYNRLYGTNVDSVFQKRYFSERSQSGLPLTTTPDKKSVNATLKFDPGWNTYFPNTAVSTSDQTAMQQDMGVMLVPSDAALNEYWNNGTGQILKDYYGTWDRVPDKVIAKLINNNMLNLFQSSVPSKFSGILDDAINPMGILEQDVDSVFIGCNGAVYLTNKVFSPTAYVSVAFPALVNPQMWIINWGIERLKYDAYLNAMKAHYSFFIPKNSAMLHYIDPVSYGKKSTQLFKFYYDESEPVLNNKVKASVWNYDLTTQAEDSVRMATYDEILNRLEDILDSHTVIGNVEDGNSFYRTKGGTTLKVSNPGLGSNGMQVFGSAQIDQGKGIPVTRVYNQKNGKVFILEEEPVMTTRNTVADILSSHDEFSKFSELLTGSGLLTTSLNKHATAGLNIDFFSRFHYTIYVPSNDAITALQNAGKLPTWDEVEAETDTLVKNKKAEQIRNFIKYHIQDNALFVDKNAQSGVYETAALNSDTKMFYNLNVSVSDNNMTVTDKTGVVHPVTSTASLRNLIAREYLFDSNDRDNASRIFSSANVVVHQIEGALLYDKNQFK